MLEKKSIVSNAWFYSAPEANDILKQKNCFTEPTMRSE